MKTNVIQCPEFIATPHGFISIQEKDAMVSGASGINEKEKKAIAAALGIETAPLHMIAQIHGKEVVVATVPKYQDLTKADGHATKEKQLFLGILTADCAPVLFYDPKNAVIGAAHAGWRGAFEGVLEETLNKMQSLGANINHIRALIGPMIHQASYEVDQQFYDDFLARHASYHSFFLPGAREGHFQFDLPSFVAHRLAGAGVKQVSDVGIDTYQDPSWQSYRRFCHQKVGNKARNIAVIGMV